MKVILQSLIEKSNNKNLINYTNAKTKKLGKKGGKKRSPKVKKNTKDKKWYMLNKQKVEVSVNLLEY